MAAGVSGRGGAAGVSGGGGAAGVSVRGLQTQPITDSAAFQCVYFPWRHSVENIRKPELEEFYFGEQ